MTNLQSPAQLRPGDVVIQPGLAFGVVTDVQPDGAELLWSGTPERPATRWTGPTGSHPLRLAMPGSFCARAVAQPAGLAQDLTRRPFDVLALLLDTLQGPATGRELARSVVAAGLCSTTEAEEWWRAIRVRLHENARSEIVWNGHLASLAPPIRSDDDPGRTFVTARPQSRWKLWMDASAEERSAMVEYAFQAGDSVASTAVVRLMDRIPSVLAPRVLKRILRGDARLGAAVLLWVPERTFDTALATAAARRDLRPVLRRVLDRIPRPFRGPAVLRLLAEAVGEDEPAALFLTELLPNGPADALLHIDALPGDHPSHSRVREWLEERLSESTMERPVRVTAPLLERLAPLPVERLFAVSLALARAFARRHAEGAAGGLDGARWRTPEEAILGAPSASTPAADIRDLMRKVAELAVGSLPRGGRMTDADLLHHLNALVRDVPPGWMAVLCQCLDERASHRPTDGLDLWTRLERARGTEAVRTMAPIRLRLSTRVGCDTHIGVHKARTGQTNQDAFWTLSEGHVTLLAVADGISVATAGSGDVASALLTRACATAWEAWCDRLQQPSATEVDARRFLEQILETANEAICTTARRIAGDAFERHIPMGTTAVLALLIGDRLHLASLGDSRAWLVGPAGAAQLTGDQNLRQEWLQSWQAREPLELLSDGSVLTGYLGHFDAQGQPSLPPVAQRSLSLLPGETLILATDGLGDYAAETPSELAQLLQATCTLPDLNAAARKLVDAANAGGGGDNVTVVLARQETTT